MNYSNADVRNQFSKNNLASKRMTSAVVAMVSLTSCPISEISGRALATCRAHLRQEAWWRRLKDQKPDLAAKKPDTKRPTTKKPDIAAKKPDLAAKQPEIKKPDVKRPDIQKPQAKRPPAGNAFDKRDGAKAKDFSNRGRASVGHRSATNLHAGA